METEIKTTQVETETTKETQAQPAVDLSKIEEAIQSINKRLDDFSKNRLSSEEIRKAAERNVLEAKIKEEEESLKLQDEATNWEKRKTRIQLRNEMWDQMTSQFINEEIPRSHIRSAMLEGGWKSGLGQMLSLALFRYLAPYNGVSIDQLNSMSLLAGENSLNLRNNPRSIITMHGRL